MDHYNNWEDQIALSTKSAPLPNEDFDQYFAEYNEIDDLFNETLTGLQDLDVPSGFHPDLRLPTTTNNYHTPNKHSRKQSGTAIFGFSDHNRELSINGPPEGSVDISKSIMPGELLKTISNHPSNELEFYQNSQPILLKEEDEIREEAKSKRKALDYIVTNLSPDSYKFPPSASSSSLVNNYSVKYLKELSRFSSPLKQLHQPVGYVDDIEPLLSDDSHFAQPYQSTPFKLDDKKDRLKFVPIPVQNPSMPLSSRKDMYNVYLPPPSPPTLTHGSPEWSSPEPQSPSPAKSQANYPRQNHGPPQNQFISPAVSHNNDNINMKHFYNPQFFSDAGHFSSLNEFAQLSSPVPQSLNSSPIRLYTSPAKNDAIDETIDANATIAQLTPLKNLFPNTPSKSKVRLEWSPIISPNAKSSKDVRAAIQQSSPRRKIKKTSLLPPGELDQYWEGPDEDKIYTCTYKNCGKKFTRRYNVKSHIQTHLSDRPFGCSYCPKKFVRQHDLNRHIKGHLEARHCQCPCGKEFSRLDAMRKHRARNICAGGIANTENSCITKPKNKKAAYGVMGNNHDMLDELTSSEKLASPITNEMLIGSSM